MHIYDRLGLTPVINAFECLTRLGGSTMRPEVLAAMAEASERFVYLDDLQAAVGRRIADLIGVEAAYVTSGAAAGLTIATAACVAGGDPARLSRLPDTRGFRNEVIIARSHRSRYDLAIQQAGVTFVEYGYPRGTVLWELEAAFTERTAAVAFFVTETPLMHLSLADVAAAAHRHGVPVIVDAAAELPPADNLRRFVDEGGDLVIFSGGKGLRGPQSSGLILGRRDLIAACAANANPNHSIGRPMKAGKEEIVGLLVALELYLAEGDDARQSRWEAQVAFAIDALRDAPGLVPTRVFPMPTGKHVPRALVRVTEQAPLSAVAIMNALLRGNPAIEVRPDPDGFVIDPQNLAPGEIEVVCGRIREILHA